jgi:hypothetical protein
MSAGDAILLLGQVFILGIYFAVIVQVWWRAIGV